MSSIDPKPSSSPEPFVAFYNNTTVDYDLPTYPDENETDQSPSAPHPPTPAPPATLAHCDSLTEPAPKQDGSVDLDSWLYILRKARNYRASTRKLEQQHTTKRQKQRKYVAFVTQKLHQSMEFARHRLEVARLGIEKPVHVIGLDYLRLSVEQFQGVANNEEFKIGSVRRYLELTLRQSFSWAQRGSREQHLIHLGELIYSRILVDQLGTHPPFHPSATGLSDATAITRSATSPPKHAEKRPPLASKTNTLHATTPVPKRSKACDTSFATSSQAHAAASSLTSSHESM
eukprot:m.156160 g.156160  ORF g.156160 m.156160 type:complete len:288 (-) comp14315_c0_seq2:107-970(-)